MAVFVFVSTGLLLSSLLLLSEKLNNVFCPGKFSNLCFFGGKCLSNKWATQAHPTEPLVWFSKRSTKIEYMGTLL
jgi:hypothetical protein